MLKRYERATEELTAEAALFARRAFVRSCGRTYGVTVPIEHVAACTLQTSSRTRFFVLVWLSEDLMRLLAKGYFYPTKSGGQLLMRFLQTPDWKRVTVNRARRDTYINSGGFPVITGR